MLTVSLALYCPLLSLSQTTSLPLELRQKIYTLAFSSSSDTTEIAASFRQRDTKSSPDEVALTILQDGKFERVPNNDTALIRVSKQVSADARPILYGYHKFIFQNTRALELFLDQIGDMRQHIRHVALGPSGYDHDLGSQSQLFGATKRSFAMLAAATGLQTLSVSHHDFCRILHVPQNNNHISNTVAASAQLLQAILDARNAKGLKVDLASLLDIVKIELSECCGCAACGKSGVQHVSSKRSVRFKQGPLKRLLTCSCKCLRAESINEVLMEGFKRSVAETLQMG
ncbi:hypothetical protein Q7P35_003280 [Cladosporium inversicolor]